MSLKGLVALKLRSLPVWVLRRVAEVAWVHGRRTFPSWTHVGISLIFVKVDVRHATIGAMLALQAYHILRADSGGCLSVYIPGLGAFCLMQAFTEGTVVALLAVGVEVGTYAMHTLHDPLG
jgi:uncharacterized membrane protein